MQVMVALDLSCAIFNRMRINLFFSLAYNCVGIPLAAGQSTCVCLHYLSPEHTPTTDSDPITQSSLRNFLPPDSSDRVASVCCCRCDGDVFRVRGSVVSLPQGNCVRIYVCGSVCGRCQAQWWQSAVLNWVFPPQQLTVTSTFCAHITCVAQLQLYQRKALPAPLHGNKYATSPYRIDSTCGMSTGGECTCLPTEVG